PNQIPQHIQNILPFTLPITQRSYTRATVNALRKIFKFDKLTDNYFAKLPILPDRYQELLPELQTYFPITSRQSLQYLLYFRCKLADYYTFTTIQSSYFELPPPKQPLPTTYQELYYRVRGLFPFNTSTSKVTLAEAVAQLKEYYIFKLLPSDYFITKLPLPNKTELIRTSSQFTYPITDDTLAKVFLDEISQHYHNQELAQLNITLPITTPQHLTQIVKTLQQNFYFKQLPPSWINITNNLTHATDQTNNTNTNKPTQNKQPLPPIPNTNEEVQSALTQNNIQLTLPIILQSQITPTMQALRQLYTIPTIPDFLLNLPPLPTPTWKIFNTSTTSSDMPPITNTVAMDTS
ncbi:6995_t:CDS:2, partial [Paraglomus occultum]